VKGIPSPLLIGCYWIRSLPNDPRTRYEYIEGSANSDRYVLTARDENCYISFQQTSTQQTEDGTITISQRAINSIGPILPGPPRLLDLRIVGCCLNGARVYAEPEYIGGTEGLSEYWWVRIKAGKRIQIGEPRAVDGSISLDEIRRSVASDGGEAEAERCWKDSRVLLLTDEDVDCVLKVKCRPVRIDGYKGEVFTSKASQTVQSKGASIDLVAEEMNTKDLTPFGE
jgi:hypothetical protein